MSGSWPRRRRKTGLVPRHASGRHAKRRANRPASKRASASRRMPADSRSSRRASSRRGRCRRRLHDPLGGHPARARRAAHRARRADPFSARPLRGPPQAARRRHREDGALPRSHRRRHGPEAGFWTPNGRHRLEAMRRLGARAITALVVPDREVAWQILALNTEKAHNLKERSLEVIRIYRGLLDEDDSRARVGVRVLPRGPGARDARRLLREAAALRRRRVPPGAAANGALLRGLARERARRAREARRRRARSGREGRPRRSRNSRSAG